ncbi:MAG: hypothetical protein ABWX65_04170, partial [Mycetocola sp.]
VSADDRFATAVDFARALQRVEMELSYAPTAIDVPNLTILERVHDADAAEAGDATRIRGVATVHAQPAPPVAPSAPKPQADATVIRGMPSIEPHEPPVTDAPENTVLRKRVEPDAEPEPVADEAPRRRLWPILAGVAGVLVIGGGIAAAVIFAPSETDAEPTPTATSDIITVGVPSPEADSVSLNADGTAVTFSWTNPEPEDGDKYIWYRSDGPNPGDKVPTDAESVVVDGITNGSQVCIDVVIRRTTGKQSTEPLEMCTE